MSRQSLQREYITDASFQKQRYKTISVPTSGSIKDAKLFLINGSTKDAVQYAIFTGQHQKFNTAGWATKRVSKL